MRADDINQLCTLIYYPRQKLALLRNSEPDMDNIYHITLHQLVQVLRRVSSKYTRSKVRKALPKEFAYIIEELLHEAPSGENKQNYYRGILDTIISTGQSEPFIEAICEVIQRLSIDRLHILGDVYDRGPGAHIIMDTLQHYRDYDIQWGNHDALWMGAAAGNECSIANAPASRSVTPTWRPWKTATASTWCPWPCSPWRLTATTPARSSSPR